MQSPRELIIEPVGLDVDALPRPIDWRELFGNDRPVELEIGMGKGTFITEQARARPEVNFFGIEWARWFWRYASDRLRRHGCANARTVRAEALYFLSEFVRDKSLAVLHVYFPDPWPKKRHHKRRLITPAFVRELAQRLKSGGYLHVTTDWQEYAQDALAICSAEASLQNTTDGFAARPSWRPQTKFEKRGLALGHAVFDILFRRR